MASPLPSDPLSLFSMSVFDMNGLLLRSGDRVTQPIGQSSARWQVLGRAGYKPHTVARMAKDMGHARQSVQRIADALVAEGLAVYRENPEDLRAKLLAATSRGKEVLAAIYARDRAWSRKLMKKLDPERLARLAGALEDIAAIFRKELDKDPEAPKRARKERA